jgi:hypothetical protein
LYALASGSNPRVELYFGSSDPVSISENSTGSKPGEPIWKLGLGTSIGLDVVVDTEKVGGVILLLDRSQPVEVAAKLLLNDAFVGGLIT